MKIWGYFGDQDAFEVTQLTLAFTFLREQSSVQGMGVVCCSWLRMPDCHTGSSAITMQKM